MEKSKECHHNKNFPCHNCVNEWMKQSITESGKCPCGKCEICILEIKQSAIKKIEELTGEKITESEESIKAICNECGRRFHTWLSDSNECPECEGQMMFFDTLEPIEDWWQEEFNRVFHNNRLVAPENKSILRNFISSLLSSQSSKIRQEMVMEIDKLKKNNNDRELLRELHNEGYNTAIKHAINIINNTKI